MRTIRSTILLAFVSALLWTGQAFAVVDQALQVQGTNLVLSWPSLGYEYYMIEYRPTLDPATPWIQLTNCLHANSTNRTTYVIPCCVLNDLGGGSSAASFSGAGDSLVASDSGASDTSSDTELWAVPANGPGDPAPLALYPPGFDTNGLVIYDAPSQSSRLRSTSSSGAESDGPTGPGMDGLTSGGCNCPDLGFFRVWHIPDWLGNVTNYVFDGPTFIPVDFKDYRDRVANIEVLLDGQPTADAIYTSLDYQGVTYWGMGVYFDLYPSGTHTLQLRTTLQLDDTVGDASVFLVLSNLTRPITVDNQVTFTNWDDLIQSTNFTFHAQTKTNNTDWRVDIYDAYGNYVNGGSGHTSNGQISWTWDLTDIYGNPRDTFDSDPYFQSYITFDAAAAAQTTRTTPAAQNSYPSVGGWLISYCDRFYAEAGFRYSSGDQYYGPGLQAMAGWVAYRSIPVSLFPIKFGTNVYSQADRDNSWADLKARLSQGTYRNFYYYGHGGPNVIGSDAHEFDTNGYIVRGLKLPGSKAYLESYYVSNVLTFNRYSGSVPYRFVWLDGCSTANGNWPGAFGTDKAMYDIGHYTNGVTNPKHRRPSAFIGWNQIIGGPGWGSPQDFWDFHEEFMGSWSYYWQSKKLWEAIDDACFSAIWPPGSFGQLDGALRVYGYTNMFFNGYNQKNDWKWP